MSRYSPGETALIVAVPQAEPAVGRWRARHDESARFGVPPHVTVLYPFLPYDAVDEHALAAIVAAVPRFEVEFASCARFGDAVLYLEPAPDAPFRQLTGAVARRWPHAPPYGGQFDDVVPHLTVAHPSTAHSAVAHTAEPMSLDAIEADVARWLPIHAEVTEVRLLAFDGGRWHPRRSFPLGERQSAESAEGSAGGSAGSDAQ
jgi:2'-5' RNA ligase